MTKLSITAPNTGTADPAASAVEGSEKSILRDKKNNAYSQVPAKPGDKPLNRLSGEVITLKIVITLMFATNIINNLLI
ncbi:hypothetical protein GTPT_0530 [Tatumella ptyseos ATCC 33301]|uniref:Uncharacterized protein n=2 Tax=Tatumella ptyseos TaxID=82987 RepID=A0A085JPG0_9GAMM|nr:hypothetical protein GTPT_0530 [Tatumella ptyseos ATCC 33301]SQK77476.1 Uncharacterised protein [Tatumella ptyseos]